MLARHKCEISPKPSPCKSLCSSGMAKKSGMFRLALTYLNAKESDWNWREDIEELNTPNAINVETL